MLVVSSLSGFGTSVNSLTLLVSKFRSKFSLNTDCKGFLFIFSQVRAVCSQLATFEVEINRLTETQASAEEELRIKTSHLQSELNQATAQKVAYILTTLVM